MKVVEKQYDLVVVGGGISGVCAAISGARNGLKTAFVQDRPVLGGNASSEVRVGINGASRTSPEGFKNAIESGVVLELMLKNKKANPQYSFHVQDNVIWGMINDEENIDLYLNTAMQSAKVENNKIVSIDAFQITTGTTYVLSANYFADTTGDANLAHESGADYTVGREARATYNESMAPEVADDYTMGSTILYTTKTLSQPVKYKRPNWAHEVTKESLGTRHIHELNNGYWWCEVGGDDLAVIENSEDIRDELIKYAYGIFDYIKNSGDFPEAANLAIDWIGSVPGKRESRRVYGDYVLTQNDVQDSARHADAVAYGGWGLDDHTIGGIRAKNEQDRKGQGNRNGHVKDVYTIPHGCIYSRNIENLYVGGRAISASHMAMSSTRVIATCAVVGQAIGTSAAIASKYNCIPRVVGKEHIHELQQLLIKDDAYLPGIKAQDAQDLISNTSCKITASSSAQGSAPELVNSDYSRQIDGETNIWISKNMGEFGGWIQVDFEKETQMQEVLLRFDPNFSKYFATRITDSKRNHEEMQAELVRDYKVSFYCGEELVKEVLVEDNCQRVNKIKLDEALKATKVKVTVLKTYGDTSARICDMRIYS
ncbi:MAG: FAD-dependent oxidoreductase [Lachnospiraceae bacterium]